MIDNATFVAFKQSLGEVFVISGIIKVEVSVSASADNARAETLIISQITKTESNNYFIVHCFTWKENNDKRIITPNTVYFRQAMFLLRCP